MRTRITLACTECKQRNYNMTKDKKTHPDRMETKKYCRFCKTHVTQRDEVRVTGWFCAIGHLPERFGGQKWVIQKIPKKLLKRVSGKV